MRVRSRLNTIVQLTMVSYTELAEQKATDEDVNSSSEANAIKDIDKVTAHQPHPASAPSTQQMEQRKRSNHKVRLQSIKLTPVIMSTSDREARDEAAMTGLETRVWELVHNLKSTSLEIVSEATSELRVLAKDFDNQILIASCGAISPLVDLLHSSDLNIQENAVTALLNLSISNNNKINIAKAEAIEGLIHVLKTGTSEARENAAATLYSLSTFEDNKVKIGNSGAIGPLVELLQDGTPRGKKDAATALFYLSTCTSNRVTIVRSGAVKHLVELMNPATGMVDRVVVVLANLASNPEGRKAIAEAGGISLLVQAIELGSPRAKENAAAALVHFCSDSNRHCRRLLVEGAVPPLVILSKSGTARAREKANTLLQLLRNLHLQAAYNARKG